MRRACRSHAQPERSGKRLNGTQQQTPETRKRAQGTRYMIKRPSQQPLPQRPQGIGASLTRKEDARFMHDRGEYVGNIRMVGMLDVAFVRSPIAHGHIVGVEKPAGLEHAVYTLADLEGVQP